MATDSNALVLTGQLNTVANRIKRELEKISASGSTTAFQSVKIENGTVKFYATTNKTGNVVGSFDLPEEIFLDQLGTTLVENFTFSALTYPNSTNPNLDGKTVLVLAVKGDAATPTVKYSFVDVSKLIDAYTAADNSITINGYTVAVKISSAANNAITVKSDGLHVDISGKVDKVTGKQLSTEDYTTAEKSKLANIEAGADVNVIETVQLNGTALTVANKTVNIDISGKTDKVANATAGHIAALDANGNLTDSTHAIATDNDISAMLTDVFGAESDGE